MDGNQLTENSTAPPRRGGGARHVYEVLRDEILELKLAPSVPLDETSLAKRFNLSRSPVREALVRLSAAGLVKMLSNRSTIVAPLDPVKLPRFIEALDYVQRVVTRLAALHRTEENLAEMEDVARAYHARCEQGAPLRLSEANKAFHMAVARAGGNPYFADAYERLLDEGRRILHLHYAHFKNANDPFPLSLEHFEMIEAIRRQDEGEADRLAREHKRIFHERLMEFMRVTFIKEL